MPPTEQFSLRWNNFYSNLSTGFYDLLEANDMVDVTLAVEGNFIQAHKIVLSICSPFFKQLFKVNPCKHPIVILKDVTFENLKDILEFMYLGEVNVLRDNLTAFLTTAELLQVKGLTGDDSNNHHSNTENLYEEMNNDQKLYPQVFSYINKNTKRSCKNTSNSPKRPKQDKKNPDNGLIEKKSDELNPQYNLNEESDYIELTNFKIESPSETLLSNNENDNIKNTIDVLNFNVPNSLTVHDNNYKDNGKNGMFSVSRHPFQCEKCSKKFSRRDHLRTHEKNIHGEDAGPFACVICSQFYKNSESLRKHIAKFHYPKVSEASNKSQHD